MNELAHELGFDDGSDYKMPFGYEEDTKHLHITFYLDKPAPNKRKSKLAGRPIFEAREMVRIRFVGDPKRIHCAPASEKALKVPGPDGETIAISYADRWPKHYDAFKSGASFQGDGTPLQELTSLSSSQVAEMRSLNIHTIEALAAINSAARKRIGFNALEYQTQAQTHLDKMSGNEVEMRLSSENTELRAQLAALTARMDEQDGKGAGDGGTASEATDEGWDAEDGSPFDHMEAQDIKAWLKDRTGKTPMGNPSHEKLIEMAVAQIAKESAEDNAPA